MHLEFCLKLYWIQHRGGRYFVHEHPHGAQSWQEEAMQELQETISQFGKVMGEAGPRHMLTSGLWQYHPPAYSDVFWGTYHHHPPLTYELLLPPPGLCL